MESEGEVTDTETVDSQDVKEKMWEGNVDMLLNSPDCEQINPEDEEEVNKIIKEEIKELEFKCRCCKFVATSFEDIEKHENGHRARGTFLECEYCEFCTNTRDVMIQHVTKHTGERPFKCKKCPFRSRWKRDLIKHQVKHSDEKKFMCSQCDFTTKWYNNIKHHQIKHSTERPFSCHICDMKFKRKTGLDYHLYRHNDYKPKKCSTCDFRCKTNFELKLHQHKHSNVRNFPCTFPGCTQRCKTKSDLSKHIKIHSNVRDKICDICNKGFATFANLSKHKLRHVTERKFQCELCTRRFKTRISLRNHLTTHNDHKPFSCDVCGHRFRNRHNMKTHKLTHSEDRAFKCPICPYAGKFPFHIFAHIGTFHGDKYAYFCEICRKPFRRYSQLQTHCGRMHKDSNLLTAVPEIKQEVIDEGQEQSSSETTTDQNSKTEEGNIPTDTVANGTDSLQAPNTQSDHQSAINSKTETGNIPTGTAANETDSPHATNTQSDDQSASNSNGAPSTQSKTHAIGENVNLLVPKSEDPNVLIYNIGPFRLPLATIGFDFNFEKTGKKPKQWFMDPQNMTDQTAAEKQRAYIEKKARGVDKSRGATLRKFDWKKPPYKPSLEENPRYKRERERQKREKEAGRSLVKQDPDLMELINLGRTNIRKVKICKRAGLLMKNWKVLEVKLEKIDAIDQKEIRKEHGTEQTDSADQLETGSIKSTASRISSESSTKRKKPTESIANQRRGGKHKMRKLTIKDMTEIHSDSQEERNFIDLAEGVSEDISTKESQIGKGFKSKSCQSTKTKRPVGRPRKHPKNIFIPKSKKIKSAIDLLPPLPKLGQISTTNVPADDLLNLPAKLSSPVIKETIVEPYHPADLKDNSTVENITNADKTQTSIDNPMDQQYEVSKPEENNLSHQQTDKSSGPKEYSRTILSVPKIPRRLPTDIGSIDIASTPSSSKKPSQHRSGRLNQTIDKLLAKKTSDMKTPKLWQPFISTEEASTTESGSHTTDGKRHRKSDAPRKIQKKGGCKRDLLDSTSSDEDDLPLSMISGKQPEQMSYEDFITELQTRNESEQQTPKRKVGRPRKTEVQNSPKKILENLLCQPFRTKRNLTDLDVLRYMDESISSRDPVVSTTTVNAPGLFASATTSKIECELSESSINRRHERRPITLPSLYNKLTLKDALTMPNEFAPDLSFKTTDLVGPEPDRTLGLPEITSLHEKDDLLRIQKYLRHEKYRLKKLDPESVAIKHISQMINSGRAPKSEKGSTSDCPILKKVLLRTKEADDNSDDDDVIITGVKDIPKKPIKIIIKKQKIEDVSVSTHTSERVCKSRKTEKSVERDRKGKTKKGQVTPRAFRDSDTSSTHIKKDPSNSSISKEVKRIKRKYTKKSSVWEVQNSKEQLICPPKMLKMKKNQAKSPGSSSKLSNIKKPRAKPLGKKCIASPDIKEVLQKYITKRRQLSLKTKKEKKKTKKVPKIKIKKTPKVSTKVKTKKTLKEKQVGKESKSKVKKNKTNLKKNKRGLKVKIMRKPKTTIHGPEIYVDIEDEDVEYMTNSLQEKIIAIPESMGAEFHKTEPMDDQDLYSRTGNRDTDFAQVSLESDCSEDPQSWQQETDTKLHLHIDLCRDSSDLDPSTDVKSTGETVSSIKIEEEEGSMDVPIIKQEKPDYCDFSAQYEDISDFEPDIPVKEESLLQSENPQILNMVHVKYI